MQNYILKFIIPIFYLLFCHKSLAKWCFCSILIAIFSINYDKICQINTKFSLKKVDFSEVIKSLVTDVILFTHITCDAANDEAKHA